MAYERQKKYIKSYKGRIWSMKNRQKPKNKEYQRNYKKTYSRTKKGKEIRLKWKLANPNYYGKYYKANLEKMRANARERQSKWRKVNKEKAYSRSKEWIKNNPERMSETKRKWRENNTFMTQESYQRWVKKHPEKIRLYALKRRSLNFIPINDFFIGSEGHHIDKDHVMFIPKKIHRSIKHDLNNKEKMERINTRAYCWILGKVEVD